MKHPINIFIILCLIYVPYSLLAQRQAKILDHQDRIRITQMHTLNSTYRETNMSITPDGKYLFFMSMRGGQPWSRLQMDYKGQRMWDGDIWYSEKRNGRWLPPRCMPSSVNTFSGEDEPTVSIDGNSVYYQSWDDLWEFKGGPYYKAERYGKEWTQAEGLGGGITAFFRMMQATDGMTMSPDEKTFIVAAARENYDDNMDIYISRKGRYGWKYCRKLPISTYGDERSVFLAGDGQTLYFASDAYGGLGGLDIYKTTLINDSTMGEVINLGPPFNTPKDDFGFILTADGNEAYFIRNGDIYFADLSEADEKIKPILPEDIHIVIKGTVKDSLDNQGLQASVILLDSKTKRLIKKVNTSSSGNYEISLPNKHRTYDQLVFKQGYKKGKKEIKILTSIKDETYYKNFILAPEYLPEPALATIEPAEEIVVEKQEKPHLTQIKPPSQEDNISKPKPTDIKVEEVKDPYSFEGVAKNNLILLLDVSASMQKPGRLPLLKKAFVKLLQHMRAEDRISIIVYSGEAKIILSGVSALQRNHIEREISKLRSGGATKGKGALRKAYKIAQDNFIGAGNNRIIMATDGYFEIPDLYNIASRSGEKNITLSVFSFGKLPDRKIVQLEMLAEKGGGNYAGITSANIDAALLKEAKAVRN